MAVPQKKKGDTRDAHSQSSFPAAAGEAGTAASPSPSPAFRRGAASSAPASTKHSTSEPVPTQSSESAGAGAGGEGGEDSRRARTAAGRRAGPGARARRRLRAEARGGRPGGEGSGRGRRRRRAGAGHAVAGMVAEGGGPGRGTVAGGSGREERRGAEEETRARGIFSSGPPQSREPVALRLCSRRNWRRWDPTAPHGFLPSAEPELARDRGRARPDTGDNPGSFGPGCWTCVGRTKIGVDEQAARFLACVTVFQISKETIGVEHCL